MRNFKTLIATLALVGSGAAQATLIGDDIDATLVGSGPAFDIVSDFGSGTVGAGIDFTATISDPFDQIWDLSLDVFADGFSIGWTERTRDGDGNISGGGGINVSLSDLDWVGMFAEISDVTLTDYGCLSAGFSCGTFSGGPNILDLQFTADSLSVAFDVLRHGEVYTFAIDKVAVPAPGAFGLLALGGLLSLGLGRRRQRS